MALADLLDRASFTKALELQSVVVPKREVAALCAQLRRHGALFDMPRLRSVVEDEGDPESRLVLLHESAGTDLAGLTEAARELLAARGAEPRLYTLRLGYEYWPAEHVLRVRCRDLAATCAQRQPGAASCWHRGAQLLRDGGPRRSRQPARRAAAVQAPHRPRAA